MSDLLERLQSALADRYTIESEIGRGGMAVVFLAEDLKHQRRVALKVLHPELSVTLAADRFLNEIQIAAGLNHPHILALFDSGEADGLLYYVMPYVEGESLRQKLERKGQLSVEESVRIAVEVADGLDYAHQHGVIHRDVKPGNILLYSKHAVIADFGIARAITVAQGERVTSTGLGVGTPLYASPEQATGAETLDGRTDIYSLGCVLYEMLSGEVPLAASTPQAVQARRLSETPASLHPMRDSVPPLLDKVIGKALAQLPADRWETAEDFGQALMTATIDATPVARLDLAKTPQVEAAAKLKPRKSTRWTITGAVVAIATLGAWMLVQQPFASGDRPPDPATEGTPVETRLILEGKFGWLLQFGTGSFAISPDGRTLAYCSRDEQSVRNLWLADLSNLDGKHEALVTGAGCSWVKWTPSGDRVHFLSSVEGRYGRYSVSRHGGSVRPFTECQDTDVYTFDEKTLLPSPDGSRMAFGNPQRKDIRILSSDSCNFSSSDSILVRGEYEFLFPMSWSPRGDRVLLTAAGKSARELLTVATEGGDQTTIATDAGLWPFWWPAPGRTLYYVRSGPYGRSPDWTRGTLKIMRQELSSSGVPRGVSEPVAYFEEHPVDWYSISDDGQTAVVARASNRYRFVRVAPDPDTGPTAATMTPLTDQILGEAWAAFTVSAPRRAEGFGVSPDGAWLAYPRVVPGGSDLFKTPLAGGDPQRLTRSGQVYGGVWSPDGRYLAYFAPHQDTVRLWLVTSDGRSTGYVRDVVPNHQHGLQWEGDELQYLRYDFQVEVLSSLDLEFGQWQGNRWVAVESAEREAPTGTFVARAIREPLVPRARFETWQGEPSDSLTVTGVMFSWALSPDASVVLLQWIRYRGPEPLGYWWWLISRRDGRQTPLAPVNYGEGPIGWTRDGSALYWQAGRDVLFWPLGGEKEPLMTLPEGLFGCEVLQDKPDLQLVCMLDESSVNLYLAQNFNAVVD